MTSKEQSAILLKLAVQLKANASWAGETHVQKAAYLLQELLGIPVGFEFILYKHGPFSFDLQDQLYQMEAEKVIQLEDQHYPYGPKIVEGPAASALRRVTTATDSFISRIEFIATKLGRSNVSTLERIATAHYVTRENGVPIDRRVQRLMELKPHIDRAGAEEAFDRLGVIIEEAIAEGFSHDTSLDHR